MSGNQARRPPVAPKPSSIQRRDEETARASPLPSPALLGAASAFRPGPVKVLNVSASHNPSASAGALLAATAASTRKQQQEQNAPPRLPPTLRGRTLTTDRRLYPTTTEYTSLSPPKIEFQPHAPRSTSAVAAVAASARTSPARRPEAEKDLGSYLARRDPSQVRRPGMSTGSDNNGTSPLQKNAAALAGAKASMIIAPVQVQIATGDRQRNDLGYLSQLTLPPVQPAPAPNHSLSGAAAAITATRNAATLEAKKRALSTSQESSPGAPPARNLTASPDAIDTSFWPQLKVTPPETDSESDSEKYRTPPTQRSPIQRPVPEPLPAPIPVRAQRAAVVAQEAALATGPSTPLLGARSNMTARSLADAMVAGALATQYTGSRRGSPAGKKSPPPPPRRRSQSVGPFHNSKHLMHFPGMRSDAGTHTPKLKPLPMKPMRHTLRSSLEQEESLDDKKRGRKHWRRHPNMHHEGDRRRWRDKITERERRRYEGVWAANRGLLVDYDLDSFESEHRADGTPAVDLVINTVTREIWERSRLPGDVLEEIWDLVAQSGLKALNREEFVVGLWLIDQRLKGSKLPTKVSQSVWSSVRHTQGVKVSNKPL